ncbi:nitrate reductase [Pseudooceanicola algae]|uniref:Nitrate reductase n=1 Tax=Pseudooceanicola algae TaxID=1537215 RepID=A0A418SBA9_9RHOB|nr:nitrate reductase [Pseudooceanicola algae]QPM91343.1 Nitrate reductase [Pseudooceanicola algae]
MDGTGLPDPAGDEIRSTCAYCGVGCGVLLRPDGTGGLAVRGDPDHPANFGRLCSKGTNLGETVDLDDRLLHPVLNGEQVGWDTAMETLATKFRDAIAAHGPDSVAFYVSGQLLTEDYYLANKLMKGFIGSANIDTNSRLCMASTVAGHKRAFGTDTVPGTYEDLEEADLVVLTGSNLAWCHPVLYQRIAAAKQARPKMRIIVIDPRRTATCDLADMHLPLKPGSDVALFNGLLAAIGETGTCDGAFLDNVDGYDEALAQAQASDLGLTGLDPALLHEFFHAWISTEKVVTVFSQGVNQSSSGSDKVNAIINCHLATGRIGKPGMGPFSVTGQPNAMGGREVGGLANTLACHMDITNPDHRQAVRQFWDAEAMPQDHGLKAVEMFQAVGRGEIKAIWIIHTNPAVSMPDADAVKAALAGCEFVAVSDVTAQTDTARLAHLLLPATAWAEKSGTVTNSDRTISRQRAVLPEPGEARPDWWALAEFGRRMGWAQAFDFTGPAEIFREHAALSGIAGGFGLDFDISGMQDLSDAAYDQMTPVRWPMTGARQGGRFFGDGRFFTASGKANMLALTPRTPVARTEPRYPFRLNTGRIRDQWHTMTRTGKSPRLSSHLAEPFLEIHPEDAARLGISAAGLVQVTSPHGRGILRALITDRVRPGDIFAPMHWTGETAPSARIDSLVAPVTDPVSGQPESKASVAAIAPYDAAFHAFAVAADRFTPATEYWARARTATGWRAEIAGSTLPADWTAYALDLFQTEPGSMQIVSDPKRGTFRAAFHDGGRLTAALFVAPTPVAVMRDYLSGLAGTAAPMALAGRLGADQPDPGPTICSCFGVGVNTILSAIEAQALISVEAIGAALQAGTNCGSCRPELAQLLTRTPTREAAE